MVGIGIKNQYEWIILLCNCMYVLDLLVKFIKKYKYIMIHDKDLFIQIHTLEIKKIIHKLWIKNMFIYIIYLLVFITFIS